MSRGKTVIIGTVRALAGHEVLQQGRRFDGGGGGRKIDQVALRLIEEPLAAGQGKCLTYQNPKLSWKSCGAVRRLDTV
jgi:hypothetical protein